jgi:hypothetical protein
MRIEGGRLQRAVWYQEKLVLNVAQDGSRETGISIVVSKITAAKCVVGPLFLRQKTA